MRIVEVKRTLSGREKRFECTVLRHEESHLVVLFISPGAMNVHGVELPAGTVTFGHFWTDRPYNVYHWLDQNSGATLGYYVNLSGDTRIDTRVDTRVDTTGDTRGGEGRLDWLDLVVDVLVLPDGRITVLDEDEIPSDADGPLCARIAAARARVLDDTGTLLAELEDHRRALWPPPGLAREARR